MSDFLAGTTSRRIGTLQFLFAAQLIALMLAAAWVAISGDRLPDIAALAAAAGTGLSLTVCLAAFFQAMVIGTISIVAPISATGVVIPIAAGIAGGEHPTIAQAIGIIAALTGIVLATRSPRRLPSAPAKAGLGLALLAALSGGLSLWLIAPASRHGVPWAILISRATMILVLAVILAARRASLRAAMQRRTLRTVLASGLLSFSAIALYAYATLHGALAIVSVLSSLYPAAPVLLAYHLLDERVRHAQQLGIAAILAGVVLLST